MSKMKHFPKYSVVTSHVKVKIDLTGLEDQFKEAQEWLGQQVLQDSRAKMPHQKGNLQQDSHTEDGGRKVIFPGPQSRYLYMGKVMVNEATGKGPRKIPTGPNEYVLRWPYGAKLRETNRPLKYSNPEARDHWFEVAKAENKDRWVKGIKKILGVK